MFKRPFAIAVGGSAALLLSACGGDSSSDPTGAASGASTPPAATASGSDTAAAAPAAPTTLPTTGAARDAKADLVIWSDSDRAPIVNKYAGEFGKENGISVAVQIVGFGQRLPRRDRQDVTR